MKNEKTKELISLLKEYKETKDSNHFIRRFYRCSLDGSYTSDEDKCRLHEGINEALIIKTDKRKASTLRMIAITRFQKFIELEFNLNQYYTIKSLKEVFNKEELETFNKDLIKDLKNEVCND